MRGESPGDTIAVVLCAGLGTRIQGVAPGRPKAMLEIGGRPLLEHQIRHLRHCGLREIWINLHCHAEMIVRHFGDGEPWGVRIRYWHEKKLLGTAGALWPMAAGLRSTFLVIYGDVLNRLDYRRFLAVHRERGALASLGLYRVPDPWNCGVVEISRGGLVRSFVEKPPRAQCGSGWVNSGIYALEPGVLRFVPRRVPADFGRDVFPGMLRAGAALAAYRVRSFMIDVGIPEKYRLAQERIRQGTWPR